jgi:BirA family biotin operon repressor/biotin-[acetyl-CoA-carboxylase] ligase
MSRLKHPSVLIDLGRAGKKGLQLCDEHRFRNELELCKQWDFQLETAGDRVSLKYDQDQLVPYWIQQETPLIAWEWLNVIGFLSIESTNDEALAMARQGAGSGTLIYAEEQTAGKGRKGRTWFSPAKTGLYFSLVLRPTQRRKCWPLLTHAAAVALGEALRDLSEQHIIRHQLDIDIKWPNDILLSGKKCAGILLEATPAEGDNHAAVVGVGVNVRAGSVPDSLQAGATYLDAATHSSIPRRFLLVRFLYHLQLCLSLFERGQHVALLGRWKGMSSMWNGTRIWIGDGEQRRSGVTCGLNEIGALLVRMEDDSRTGGRYQRAP